MHYKSVVRSHIEYTVQVWSPYTITLIKKIEKVQMRATNMLFCTKGLPYHERLTLFNVPTLRNKIIRGYMIMVYKLVSSVGQNSFKNYFENKK